MVVLTRAMLQEVDLGLESLHKPMHIQLLYAWCCMFSHAGQCGIAPVFIQAIRGYADQLGSEMRQDG